MTLVVSRALNCKLSSGVINSAWVEKFREMRIYELRIEEQENIGISETHSLNCLENRQSVLAFRLN